MKPLLSIDPGLLSCPVDAAAIDFISGALRYFEVRVASREFKDTRALTRARQHFFWGAYDACMRSCPDQDVCEAMGGGLLDAVDWSATVDGYLLDNDTWGGQWPNPKDLREALQSVEDGLSRATSASSVASQRP